MSATNCHYHVYTYTARCNWRPITNIIRRTRAAALRLRSKTEAPLVAYVVRCYQSTERCA